MIKSNAFIYGFNVGDTVKYANGEYVVDTEGAGYSKAGWIDFSNHRYKYELVKPAIQTKDSTSQDGGPSSYYDPPFKDWITVNDMVDYYAEKKWKHLSWIFKDILKAVTRWGDKQGTSQEYDANKIIYYGCRLLMSIKNKEAVRAYLQRLLNDKQFGG